MKRHLAAVAVLLLAGCVTTESITPGTKPDMAEAARLNTQLGIDYMRKGQTDLALEKFERALEQDPDLGIAHSSIAFLYARKGEKKKAEKHYREAIDLNADDPFTLNNFGIFLCGQGEIDDAEEYFLEAAKSPSNTAPEDAWTNAGVCVRRDNKLDKAEQYLREALQLNPRHPNALAQMAWLTFQRKDFLRTRAFLQRYEAVGPPTAETLWIGAQTERQLGDRVAAIAYERSLKSRFPDSKEANELFRKAGK